MTSATKNSFWYLSFNLLRMLVLFLGNMWVSRILGPESFGQFSYLLTIILYLSAIDSLCHESVVKQYLSRSVDNGLVMGTSSILGLFLAFISILIIVAIGYISFDRSAFLFVFFLFIPGQFAKPFAPIANSFDAKLLSKYSSLALLLGAVLSMSFRTVSVTYSKELYYQSFGYSLQAIIFAAVLFWFYTKEEKIADWKFSLSLLGDILKKSFPIFLSAILFLSFSLSDILMIHHILDVREVGIYSMVVKLCEPWVIVSSALCTSYFPLIFRSAANLKKQSKYFVSLNQISLVFVVILGLILCTFIDEIVSVTLGDGYSEVGGVFKIYYWSILFLFFANIQHIWEVLNDKYSLSLYRTAAACFLKIGLNFILGSSYGLAGFAVATLVSFFFYGMGFNMFSKITRKYLKIQIRVFSIREFLVKYRLIRTKGKKWLKKES
jgi:O-antigen/teichoic acid export membrane protein